MNLKLIKYFGNIFFVLSIVISFYVLIDIYLIKPSLSAGVCPINNKKEYLYISMSFALISIVLSFIEKRFTLKIK